MTPTVRATNHELAIQIMLKVYSDESEDGHVLTLAGWMASPTGWRIFRQRWRAMLREFKASEFHMADLMADPKIETEYSDWSEQKKRDFLEAALKILTEDNGALFSVACSIAINAHVNRNYWPWKQSFAAVGGFSYSIFPSARSAEFIFDEKEKVKGWVQESYRYARHHDAQFRRFTSSKKPNFQSSIRTLPLQAADLLAWTLRRSVSQRLRGKRYPLPWLLRLRNGCKDYRWACVDFDGWRRIKAGVDAGLSFHRAWSAHVTDRGRISEY